MKPLISICMPNYNYEKYIREAIESVLSQTYQNFEIIIVDDNSTDNSIGVIKSYNDPRIKLYQNETNLYTFKTNNKALSLANGELIAVLHSDDKYEPDFLEKIIESYDNYPEHRVFITGVYFYHSDKSKLIPWHPYDSGGIKSQSEVLIRLFHQNNIGNGVNVVFHRECLQKAGTFSEEYKYIADYDFLLKLANKYEFIYIPKMLSYYRVHSSNATSSNIKQRDRDQEVETIVQENLAKCTILPKHVYKQLNLLAQNNGIQKSFYMGIRYNSGKITRFMLNSKKDIDPGIAYNAFWSLIYLHSYFIADNLPKFWTKLATFTGRALLYPSKIYTSYKLKQLINRV